MIPQLEHVCDFAVEMAQMQEFGACPQGLRRVIPIVGGTVSGPLINGRILGIGADWQTVSPDGIAELDARYVIETDDGAWIEVISQGMRHASPEIAARIAAGEAVSPGEYYMRTLIHLASGHPDYAWVNCSLFLASGGKIGTTVHLSICRVA